MKIELWKEVEVKIGKVDGTRIFGDITPKLIENMQDKLVKAAMEVKTCLLEGGNRCGHLCIIVSELMGNPM